MQDATAHHLLFSTTSSPHRQVCARTSTPYPTGHLLRKRATKHTWYEFSKGSTVVLLRSQFSSKLPLENFPLPTKHLLSKRGRNPPCANSQNPARQSCISALLMLCIILFFFLIFNLILIFVFILKGQLYSHVVVHFCTILLVPYPPPPSIPHIKTSGDAEAYIGTAHDRDT